MTDTRFKPLNQLARTHGARSQKALQQQHRRIRAQSRAALIVLKPELSRTEYRHELELGVDALVRLEAIRQWTARIGGHVTTSGQLRAGGVAAHETAAAEWDRWCRRNGVAYQASTAASRAAEAADDAEAAHKRLLARYAQESE